MLGPAKGGVQSKAAGVGEAVQHPAALRKPGHPAAVELLVEEKARLLAVFDIYQVEYAILKLFMQNPGRALSREDVLTAVWGRDYDGELKIVDVNIRRLRIKIEDDATSPKFITTVWGFGYKWGA